MDTRAIAIQHRLDEQAVVGGRASNVTNSARQKAFNALPLRVAQSVSTCHAPDNGAISEIDDMP
jgi:hypothetical protein